MREVTGDTMQAVLTLLAQHPDVTVAQLAELVRAAEDHQRPWTRREVIAAAAARLIDREEGRALLGLRDMPEAGETFEAWLRRMYERARITRP